MRVEMSMMKEEYFKLQEKRKQTYEELETLLVDFLNGKITKKELEFKYKNYCELRDM